MANIVGTDNSESLVGTSVDDVIQGRGGDDSINGREGDDTISGGTGADILFGEAGNDELVALAGETAANEIYNGGSGFDSLVVANGADFRSSQLTSIEQLEFIASSVVTTRINAASISRTGLAVNLAIVGNSGIDTLEITMADRTSIDLSQFTYTDWDAEDRIVILGDSASETYKGSWANDFINPFGGLDTVLAGAGNDTYRVAQAGDVAAEVFLGPDPGGEDRVIAAVDATLTGFIENLELDGAGNLSGTGNSLANLIKGNSGKNVLSGLDGADRLIGGEGRDQLFGGAGNDRFAFTDIADSVVGSERDRIRDFIDGDRIDLAAIDADETVAGNQAFAVDLDGSFSTGEIRLVVNGSGDTIVSLNTNADAGADMQIAVVGVADLTAADFIL